MKIALRKRTRNTRHSSTMVEGNHTGITVDNNLKISQQVKTIDNKQTNKQTSNPQAKQIKQTNKNSSKSLSKVEPKECEIAFILFQTNSCSYSLLSFILPKKILPVNSHIFQIPLFMLPFLPCMPGQEEATCEL